MFTEVKSKSIRAFLLRACKFWPEYLVSSIRYILWKTYLKIKHHFRSNTMFGRYRHHAFFESAGGPGEPGGHGGRGPRRRMFESGHLRLMILDLIGETPRHGYDVIKALEARCGGMYSPSPGVVYPTLSLLEDQGYVTVEITEGSKKRYTVTDEGRAHLAENKPFLDPINARLAGTSASRH